jgi:hypothetical protein
VSKSELRHFCRHCRSKLSAPTGNHREAFDSPGCFKSFYLHRCVVCEREMPRNAANQRTCYRASCKTAWRERLIFSHFLGRGTAPVKLISETPINKGVKEADKYGRRWLQIAGPKLTPNQFHCATVPDGPDCKWEGGAFERIEAKNKAALETHFKAEIEANGYFTDTEWTEVISPDEVKCFVACRDSGKGP